MNNPIKIIWKFKNNNKRIQYHQYIYIGNIDKQIYKILERITDMNLYQTLNELNNEEYKMMVKIYGEKWYEKFFNIYHINSSISTIKNSVIQKKEIITKLGKEWYDNHIESRQLIEKKLIYNYETLIKYEYNRTHKTKKQRSYVVTDKDIDIDYSTIKKVNINGLLNSLTNNKQKGGNDEQENDEQENNEQGNDKQENEEQENEEQENDEQENEGQENEEQENEGHENEEQENEGQENEGHENDEIKEKDEKEGDNIEMTEDEENEMIEIEKMYDDIDVDIDDNIIKTSKLIKQVLDDENIYERNNIQLVEFDKSKDNNTYDEQLKDVYKKHYVTSQYIYIDDTIKTIKNKICCGIRNNNKFIDMITNNERRAYIIPSRQYLWGEYYYENNLEKIMLGHKWMRRNELLAIDIEPNNNMRYYEELTHKLLKTLHDNMKRYNNKIRKEDDETNILYDYKDYIINNEIYMIDIYNELGKNYKIEEEIIKNLQDVYLKLYFPKIKNDDIKNIINYLNGDNKNEINKTITTYENINNDLIIENEIMNTTEILKKTNEYNEIFKENYITQSVIHINLHIIKERIDLYRLFNNFIISEEYPFIQYHTTDGNIVYKFNESEINNFIKKKENIDILQKWFENAPYGISFKIKIKDKNINKYMAITLNENNRIEYKTQWREEDKATFDDIKITYTYIKELITKINNENDKSMYEVPLDNEFRYAFINTIQRFELPDKFAINHNDLSDFAIYFYPYIALVIEPRKRLGKTEKIDKKSKFGTYLRYKRVSKYENQARLEQRIMYFIRNYEFTNKTLANEISKQFNILEEKALENIERIQFKYPNLKKVRKILKKLEKIPKYKPPGIGIDIQGKYKEKYKIRISGARDNEQLTRMNKFMNNLIFLYIETYLYKRPERQILKEKLKELTNIAKRRNKVDNIVDYSQEIKSIKQMTQIDKRRIGFKPDKGQNQWTRSCQNSGDDKKRRPQQYNDLNIDELIKKGYILNKKLGIFEKKIINKNKKETILKTIKLNEFDNEGNSTGNDLYYACDIDENGDHVYVGFLTKSMNPYGHCMPCCFKKDPMISKNNKKKQFFLSCLGNNTEIETIEGKTNIGDKLYILQDTNKIQEGRFGFLPKYLDFYLNVMLEKQKNIKHHYLIKTKTGYFFKYGSKQDEYPFLNAIASILDMTVDEIIKKIIDVLNKDKNEQIFTYINNGDIKTQFETKEKYIQHILQNPNIDFDLINSIISIPKILINGGLNIILFQKYSFVIKKTFEKEEILEDFNIVCQNNEDLFSLTDLNKNNIFIMKENKNYYPIVMVKKEFEDNKSVDIIKIFKYEKTKFNIIHHIEDYYKNNCHSSFINNLIYKNESHTAKETLYILNELNNKELLPKYQLIDMRNKCKYIITANNIIIPVRPSGSLYNITIVKNLDNYIMNFEDLYKHLNKIYDLTDNKLSVKPYSVYYDEKIDDSIKIIAIATKTKDTIPIIPIKITINKIEKMGLLYENKPLIDKLDNEILKGQQTWNTDERIIQVKLNKYENDSYEQFRYEFSNYINKTENSIIKHKINLIINNSKIYITDKIIKIRLILYKLIDLSLYDKYTQLMKLSDDNELNIDIEQNGGKYDKFIHITTEIPDLINYIPTNEINKCSNNKTKEICNIKSHCHWTHTGCYMSLTKSIIVIFVNKISEELALNNLNSFELMKVGNYFVSDIIDRSLYTERENQKLVKSTSSNLKKILNDIFGKDNIPIVGKKRIKRVDIDYQQLNLDNPLIDMKIFYLQKIIEKNLTFFRAYVNGLYWINNKNNDIEHKNLGYYSPLQTELSNYFKGLIIDWLKDDKNKNIIKNDLLKYMNIKSTSSDPIHVFIIKLAKDILSLTNCIVELFILNKINNIPIIVYNENNIKYVFDDGLIYNSSDTHSSLISKYTDPKLKKNYINLRFILLSNNIIPDNIEVIYYKDI